MSTLLLILGAAWCVIGPLLYLYDRALCRRYNRSWSDRVQQEGLAWEYSPMRPSRCAFWVGGPVVWACRMAWRVLM